MKPVRGSGRKSTQGPLGKGAKKKTRMTTEEEPAHRDKRQPKHQQVMKQKKPSQARAVKSGRRERWKPLVPSVTSALDRMLSLSVLTVLSLKLKEKEETQRHLNIFKESFLATCAQLTVPPRKRVDLGLLSRQYQAESTKVTEGEKRLGTLTENHRSVVTTLEEMEVTKDRLDKECRLMRFRLEEQEELSQDVLQRSKQTVLHLLPVAPLAETEPLLQDRLKKSLPNKDALAKALRNLAKTQDLNHLKQLINQQGSV